jgi:thiol-disulfide isomerase/thioredoxin
MTRTAVLRPLASALVASLALAGVLAVCTGGGGNPGIGIATGLNAIPFAPGHRNPVPSFSGTTLRGDQPISAAILSGKVGVVNFWGSWCGPCRREQGPLETLSKQYGARVQFVGVNARRDQKAAALAYLDEFKVTYPSVYNPDSSIAYAFRVRFMPATFVIDRQGKIAAEFIGAIADANQLRVLIDAELS